MDDSAGEFIRIQTALAGRYSLERELGRGGMGIVYLARDVALDRLVALKLFPPVLSGRESLRQRFLNEARTAAKLSHPNIIPIFAVEEVGEFVFFVMSFVDGETLGQYIRNRGALPPSETARIVREVAWALAYAHGQGVIHRDVKAENILIERATGRALIADFGIARVTKSASSTGAGEVLGTAEYMSPEQAGGGIVDPRSDIYSLGIVAFYALAGRLPFEGATVQAILSKHMTQPAPRVRDVCDGVPSRLARAVDRCLEKDPDARYPKAEDLADDVSAVLEARRELPPPIRVFIRRSREISQLLGGVAFFQIVLGFEALGFALTEIPEVAFGIASVAVLLGLIPVGPIVMQARTLLKAGYQRSELTAAWRSELEREREERMFEHGRRAGRAEKIFRAVAIGGALAAIAGGIVWSGQGLTELAVELLLAGGTAMVSSGAFAFVRYERRADFGGRLMSRFWNSRLGHWAFKLAAVGIDRTRIAAPATHRPTELAIGMAVDALFESLPRDVRDRLGDLPKVVRGLEANAMKIRGRVEELDDAVSRAESGVRSSSPNVAAAVLNKRRDSVDRDLRGARDEAKRRLSDAVTALEGIRLNLLRLTAGAGSVDSLTADLTAARQVSEDVTRLLQAYQETDAMLGKP